MTLPDDQDALLRQTARGTPMGDFLRQYWHPVASLADLTSERPTRRVRVLSQALVLFKDKSGRAALIPERCPHEGASMLMGAINDHGITCVLHGWFFDTERMRSVWDDDSVWADGYPVREHAGLYWAYLGPEPAPPLPVNGILAPEAGPRRITQYPPLRANWLLEAPAHLHAGPLWLLTPLDREQTMLLSVELISAGEANGQEPEIVTATAIEARPDAVSDGGGSFLAPWGSVLMAGSETENLYRFVLGQLAATRD